MNLRPVERPYGRTVEIEGARLRVPWKGSPEGISGPSAAFLEIELDDRRGNGCASGRIGRKLEPVSEIRERTITLELCPMASRERDWNRWHVEFDRVPSGLQEQLLVPPVDFETSLASDGEVLLVRARETRADIRLPGGSFGEAVRRHPELLATVVLAGFVPRSSSARYELLP